MKPLRISPCLLAILAAIPVPILAEDATMTMSGESMMSSPAAASGDAMMSGGDTMMSSDNMMSGETVPGAEANPVEAKPEVEGQAAPVPAVAPLKLQFVSTKTIVPRGETRMIPIRRTGDPKDEVRAEVQVEGGSLEILRQPEFLAGQPLAFLRVRAADTPEIAKSGAKTILIAGDTRMEVAVTPETSPTRTRLKTPTITAPAMGSAVLGEFSVGVELFADATQNLGGAEWKLGLELPDGRLLEPKEELGVVDGPVRRAMFIVQAADLPGGRVPLVPVAVNEASGEKFAGFALHVLPLAEDSLVVAAGECEDFPLDWERPKDWRTEPPSVGVDVQASGQMLVRAPGGRPIWGLPVTIPEDGSYQLFMRVRGDMGGGSFPTLALALEKGGRGKATVRMVSSAWHRLPIGPPVNIKKGENAIGAEFTNDFNFSQLNRDAYLDTYELVKVKYREPEGDDFAKPTPEEVASAPATPLYFEPASWDLPLRVTFTQVLDGLDIKGLTQIDGAVWRQNQTKNEKQDQKRKAKVTLFLNGQPVQTLEADRPKFSVPAHKFAKGENKLRLYAYQSPTRRAWSETVTVFRREGAETLEVPKTLDRRVVWAAKDGAWQRLEDQDAPEGAVFTMLSAGVTELDMPDGIKGRLVLNLKGDVFNGEPEAVVKLGDKEIAKFKAGPEWVEHVIEKFNLPEKDAPNLSIEFTNDAFEAEGKDRNLYVGTVRLEYKGLEPDKTAPVVKVLYPREGQELSTLDALVVNVFDARKLDNLDVVLNGKSLKYWMGVGQNPGPVSLPLVLRDVPPGEHTLSVTLRDEAGNETKSPDIKVRLTSDMTVAARMQRPYDRAERLLRRFGYGPEPAQLAQVLTVGEEAWLRSKLQAEDVYSTREYRPHQYTMIRMNKVDSYQVANRAIFYGLVTDNPVRARFNYWIQNHFSTWQNKTGNQEKWDEHMTFLQTGVAPFFDLLYASSTSSAMMVFLDQRSSYAGKINENYAREIMELHTVGVKGGYTQQDVTELAGMLTGWAAQKEGVISSGAGEGSYVFRYSPYLNDGKGRDIFGLRLPAVKPSERFDRVRQYLEMLAARPEAAHYFSSKMAAHYYGPGAPEALVESLAQVYLETGGDTAQMLLALSQRPEFWSDQLPSKVAQPLDYGIGLQRMTSAENNNSLHEMMQKAGRAVFDRSTPDGYPEEDDEYSDSNFMLQKWRYAKTLEWELTRGVPWSYWQPNELETEAGKKRLINFVAARLTGGYLSERSEEAALKVLNSDIPDARQKFNQLAVLVAQLPETQMR